MHRSVRKDVIIIPGSPVTLVVRCKEGNWLVDPGIGSGRYETVMEVLGKIGVSDFNILVSHSHYDHVEVLPYFKDKYVYVNEAEYSQLVSPILREQATYGFNPLPRLMRLQRPSIPSKNVRVVSPSTDSDFSCFKLLDLSGHSPGLTGIVLGDVVFVGDSLFGDVLLRRVGIPYHSDVFKSLKVLNDVLWKLSDEGFEAILSHGPVVRGQRFRELVELNVKRIEQIVELLNDKLRIEGTIEELTVRLLKELGVEVNASNVYLGCVTVSSIINKLCDDGVVEHTAGDGGVRWRLRRC